MGGRNTRVATRDDLLCLKVAMKSSTVGRGLPDVPDFDTAIGYEQPRNQEKSGTGPLWPQAVHHRPLKPKLTTA